MFNDSQNLATSIPPHKFMFCLTLREPRYSCAPPLDASAGTVSTFMARACLIIILVLPYSLYAQSRPVMLSVSAWNHTHGARYQNRTGTYRLEVCRSAINLIRRMPPSFRGVSSVAFEAFANGWARTSDDHPHFGQLYRLSYIGIEGVGHNYRRDPRRFQGG